MKWLLTCLLCVFVFAANATAHVLDEYVQAAQITLARDSVQVELRLTPGVQVANRVFGLIDVNGDKQISPTEEQTYAQSVIHDTSLELDGQVTPLTLIGINVPTQREMSGGSSAIRLVLTAKTKWNNDGEHQLSFSNKHQPHISVYLANVLAPSTDAIKIKEQQRDKLQHKLSVSFVVTPEAHDALLSNSQIAVSSNAHGWPRWIVGLIAVLCLTLVVAQWKRLNGFLRRSNS